LSRSALRGAARATASPLLAVLLAALFGAALALLIGENPLRVLRVLVEGAFATADGFASVLFQTTALVFTGLSVAFAFRAGLFNIGAEGQLVMGAFLAALAALSFPQLPGVALVPLCVAAAALGGAVWGAIPGLLRAALGVHEVINTIMMNFIASGITGYLTVHVLREPGQQIPHTAMIPEAARIARLGEIGLLQNPIPAASPANVALLLALAAAALIAWLLQRTPFGFEVRALGLGSRAARVAGMPTSATLVAAMAVAGALAGLGGVNEVLGFRYRFLDNFSSGIGFLGIAVALLGRARVGGVIGAAFLFGVLNSGALEIDIFTDVPREIVLVVEAGILLFVVAGDELLRRLVSLRARGVAGAESAGGAGGAA
jgi:simple sugar transport system permease protein